MPLLKGKSNIGKNIKELETNGSKPRGHKQIVAIALHEAYDGKKPGNKLKKLGIPKQNGKTSSTRY